MRIKYSNLPEQYYIVVEISPKNTISIKVIRSSKGGMETKTVVLDKKNLGLPPSVRADTVTKENFSLQIYYGNNIWGNMLLNFKTGNIKLEHNGREHQKKVE